VIAGRRSRAQPQWWHRSLHVVLIRRHQAGDLPRPSRRHRM